MNKTCTLILLALLASPSSADNVGQPNIVLIFAGDLGWNGVRYAGSDFYETPNIDRLAREAMIFENGDSGAAHYQPSRACLLTGQYTPRHEVYALVSRYHNGNVNFLVRDRKIRERCRHGLDCLPDL